VEPLSEVRIGTILSRPAIGLRLDFWTLRGWGQWTLRSAEGAAQRGRRELRALPGKTAHARSRSRQLSILGQAVNCNAIGIVVVDGEIELCFLRVHGGDAKRRVGACIQFEFPDKLASFGELDDLARG
jgi:hypothetical protein